MDTTMAEQTYYPTIAAAEQAITDAGYARDLGRAIWVNAANKTAKIVRGEPGKFYVQWS
jgi:hypothetical protein